MFWAVRQLLVPCNYLRISHGRSLLESKAVYDFVFPAGLTVATGAACLGLDVPLSIFKQAGLFGSISTLLAVLIGFYMAALAAVSTFERAGIDQPLKGGDAILRVRNAQGGGYENKKLSYRQFISYLFGYASFLSFIIYALLLLLNSTWAKIESIAHDWQVWSWIFENVVEPATFIVVFFGIWQLFITSLLGIYFLAERLQGLNEP